MVVEERNRMLPVEVFLDVAVRACYYGSGNPDTTGIMQEYMRGDRIVSIALSPDGEVSGGVLLSGRLHAPDMLAIDVFYAFPARSASSGALRHCIRRFKWQAEGRGVKHVYTMVHYANPQAGKLLRFYQKFMGFREDAVRLYAPIERIKDV